MKLKDRYKVFNSIDSCPIWNYEKVKDTGNAIYICDVEDYSNITSQEYMNEAFDKVFNEFYNYFGISTDLIEFLNAKKAITILEIDYQLTKEPILASKLAQKKEEFQALYRTGENDIDKLAVQLSRWVKFDIDTKKISVKRFYNYLNSFIKENGKN